MQDLPDGGGADPVAESGELTVDAPIPPGRILGGQAQSQRAHSSRDGGTTRPNRWVGPVTGEELPVPAQDGGGRDDQPESATGRQQLCEHGDHGSVSPGHPRPWGASLQHGDLMAQDEDLDVLGGVGADAQHYPAQQLREHPVDQP